MLISDFLQALLELELSASSDEAVRERIASLPPEVSEVALLSRLEGNELDTPFIELCKAIKEETAHMSEADRLFHQIIIIYLIIDMKQDFNWLVDRKVIPPPPLAEYECACAQKKAYKHGHCSKL